MYVPGTMYMYIYMHMISLPECELCGPADRPQRLPRDVTSIILNLKPTQKCINYCILKEGKSYFG